MPTKRNDRRSLRVRQADVARDAGVSQATVSIVLGDLDPGRPRTSAATRQRVTEVAERLGYSVNPVARSLIGGRNRLIGVYTFETVFPTEARDFYQEFFLGIEHAAELTGYDLLLFTSARVPGQQRSIYAGGVNRLGLSDGSILLGRHGDMGEVERLAKEGFPFVYVGRRELRGTQMSYVTADYAAATEEVVRHLAVLGHRAVAYLGTTTITEPDLDRVAGWERAVEALELSEKSLLLRPSGRGVDAELVTGLQRRGVTALVLEDPQSARGVFEAVETAGLSVPDDLSIAVLGDDPSGPGRHRAWTGFGIPREAMGRAAVTLLIELFDNPDAGPRRRSLPCSFESGTTANVPRAPLSVDRVTSA